MGIQCGVFGFDEVRAIFAAKQGINDARQAIENGNFQFRIGGKRSPYFNDTAIVFSELCGAELIRSYECCPTPSQMRYDFAFNDTMEAAIAARLDGFHFATTYAAAAEAGQKQFDLHREAEKNP